ncbi:FAD-binding protein [Haloactinomyces albus]|uniref:Succinate dehydrogenase/fumarate reductase flavoprotein subunit n=1 Tax=Haloactinomyces albus TaxID=1352928 RepID=A0AAE3ZH72_9ACTN|nr:FAD-binding protein [Haloactinomyces albus]MDR7303856.1 succinate dehydrogenase/fumarate reductase flavoprotein subunit [Haloactinomyces albus]
MTRWDEQCDVLVVGSGGGALTGAYVAGREGLSVAVIEATDRFGGTTAYSGGGMWFPCNAVLRRAGDDDTMEAARTYFRSVVGKRTPRELQDSFLDNGAPLIDYLEADPNFEFRVFPWPDYFGSAPQARAGGRHIIPESLSADRIGTLRDALRPPLATDRLGHELPAELGGGQALIGRLLLALSGQPHTAMHRETTCEELIVEDGAVVGVLASRGGKSVAIRTRRGVLLAAGGFERNAQLREQWGVPGSVAGSMGAPGNTGRALQAALRAEADTDLLEEAWWAPGMIHPDGTSTFSLWLTGGIFVNGDGARFTNESWPYDRIGRDIIDGLDKGSLELPFWMVYDDRAGDVPPVRSTSVPMASSEEYARAGLRHSASSLGELAECIGVPADALGATVERFNRMVARGVDEDFHRGAEPYDNAFAGAGGSPLVPIEQPPYHATAFGLSDLGTKGGLRTDNAARVLDRAGLPISGLYAAGNSMAAVSGTSYPAGGNPIAASMVFSYLAALDMAGTADRNPPG